MTRPVAWSLQISTLLVAGTGLVYAWMLYFCDPIDEWAVVNHPGQPQVQALHILVAPLLVFFCGLVWRSHVWLRICTEQKPRRKSGIILAAGLPPMVASGYLLQISVDESWRSFWVWIHVGVSILWLAIYGLHMLLRRDPATVIDAPGVNRLPWPEPAVDRSSPTRSAHLVAPRNPRRSRPLQ